MSQCVKCGKNGFFLKVNEKQLCENCANEERKTELNIRQQANEVAKFVHSTTMSISDTAELIISLGERGVYTIETMEAAMKILDEAMAQTEKAITVVRDPDVSKIQPTVEYAEKTVKELHSKILGLLNAMV